jgi:hypothetical protein
MSEKDEEDFAALEHHHVPVAWTLLGVLLAGAVACTSIALLAQG